MVEELFVPSNRYKMETKIKLVIADDEILFRQGLRAIISKDAVFDVLFDASDGKDLMNQLRVAKVQPDIVITDLKMPEMNGVDVTKAITEEFPDIKIIALTSYFTKPFILNLINIGAVAYLAKNSTPSLMMQTIKEVAQKGFFYDSQVLAFLKEGGNNPKNLSIPAVFDENHFTQREIEVLALICKQLSTKEIAEEMFLSPRTVDGHRNRLLQKTNSKNIAGLVVYAIKYNLVKLDIT